MTILRVTTALSLCLALAACPGDDTEDTGSDPTSSTTASNTGSSTMTPPATETGDPDPTTTTNDPSTTEPGTSTSMADSDTTAGETEAATDTDDCLTCAQVQNEMGDPALLCEGEAQDAFNAVAGCICGNCGKECAPTACGMPPMPPDQACLDCFVPLCMDEIGACNEA